MGAFASDSATKTEDLSNIDFSAVTPEQRDAIRAKLIVQKGEEYVTKLEK